MSMKIYWEMGEFIQSIWLLKNINQFPWPLFVVSLVTDKTQNHNFIILSQNKIFEDGSCSSL